MLYDPEQPLVSLHIPKTAGSSLRQTLQGWFPADRLKLHYPDQTTLQPPERCDFSGPICVHGHFDAAAGLDVGSFYPDARQFMTFFRDPFERAISFYCFMHARRRSLPWRIFGKQWALADSAERMSFERWIAFLQGEQAAGRGAACRLHLPAATSLDGLKRDLARRFVFVGLTETYGRSLAALAVALGKPRCAEHYTNATDRGGADFGRWRCAHEKAFPEEYDLYETAVALNRECLRRYEPCAAAVPTIALGARKSLP